MKTKALQHPVPQDFRFLWHATPSRQSAIGAFRTECGATVAGMAGFCPKDFRSLHGRIR